MEKLYLDYKDKFKDFNGKFRMNTSIATTMGKKRIQKKACNYTNSDP